MEKIQKDKLRGHLDGLVLSVLEQGDGHGYEILQRLRTLSEDALQLKEGSLYPALYRLEKDAQIKAKWESGTSKRPGPRRRIYSITTKGKRTLTKQREEWQTFRSVIGRIMEQPT